MRSSLNVIAPAAAGAILLLAGCAEPPRQYVGSASCRECHAEFYELWSTSHHGTALHPWSERLAAAHRGTSRSSVGTN